MPKYTRNAIAMKFCGEFVVNMEPELTLLLNGKEYMIIFYGNRCSFQRCGNRDGSGEVFFDSFSELCATETIDDILLERDWNDIIEFECWDYTAYYGKDF
jgi:hypothetical protein